MTKRIKKCDISRIFYHDNVHIITHSFSAQSRKQFLLSCLYSFGMLCSSSPSDEKEKQQAEKEDEKVASYDYDRKRVKVCLAATFRFSLVLSHFSLLSPRTRNALRLKEEEICLPFPSLQSKISP